MKPGAPGYVPWEDPTVPFPANLGLTWWDCLVSPDLFFDRVDWEGPLSRPLLYFLLVAILASLFGLFWFLWDPWGFADEGGLATQMELLGFFLTPFFVLAMLGIGTAMTHLFAVLLAPRHRSMRATATVLCYAAGIGLLTALLPPAFGYGDPFSGAASTGYLAVYLGVAFAVQVWHLFVLVMGVRRAHSTSTGRAVAIVLLPVAIAVSLAVGLLLAAMAMIAIAGLPV